MTEIYMVMRPVPAGMQALPSGTLVNAANWRNLGRLVSQRYIRPATEKEIAAMTAEKDDFESEKPAMKKKGGRDGQ